jgi:hypothetical protein
MYAYCGMHVYVPWHTLCVYTVAYIHIHTHTCIHTCVQHIHSYIHAHMHMCVHAHTHTRIRSMRSMRSMRWDLFSVIRGPCKRYAVTLTRMPVHNCLPGPHSAASMEELPCDKTQGSAVGWRHKHRPTRSHRTHAFPCVPTTTPVSTDFVPPPPRVRDWAPVGNCAPLAERIPTRSQFYAFYAFYALGVLFSVIGGPCKRQYPPTLGKTPARYTSKPPRACPTQVWDPASHVMRNTAGPLYSLISRVPLGCVAKINIP